MKKKIFALALAAVMLVSGAMTAIAAESVTVTNAGWWDAWTPGYELKDGATLEFDVDLTAGGAAVYQNLNTVFANVATDGVVEPKADNYTGYAEHVVLRTDNFGWGTDYANTTYTGTDYFFDSSITDYTAKNTGAHYDLTISRTGNKIDYDMVLTAGDGTVYNIGYEVNATDLSAGCYVFFTGDAGVTMTVTPVEAAASNPGVAAKGDVSTVMTYVVLFAGAALVVVASKKRFA